MLPIWLEGNLRGDLSLQSEKGNTYSVPVQLQFLNNGVLSVSMGDDMFIPSEDDLGQLGQWTQGVAKGMGIPEDQVFVGAYLGRISK